jgi:hypothetical protein
VKFFVDTNTLTNSGKAPYAPFLPTPEAGSAPAQPVTLAQLQKDPAPARRHSIGTPSRRRNSIRSRQCWRPTICSC